MRRHQRRGRSFQLKGLKRYWSGGIYYVYHRASKTQLPAHLEENDPEFIAAYQAAVESVTKQPDTKRVAKGSIAEIANRMVISNLWKSTLRESTRAVYRRDLNKLVAKAGHVMMQNVRRKHIENDLDKLEPIPANLRLRVWRKLIEFCRDEKIITIDPSEGVKSRKEPESDGHTPWERNHLETFREFWPIESKPRIAMEIFNWTGARVVDVRTFGPQHIRSGWLEFKQVKTRFPCVVPVGFGVPQDHATPEMIQDHKHFMNAIEAAKRNLIWVTTEYGKPRSQKGLSQWFSQKASDAGLPKELTAHGLRKRRDMDLAEAGMNAIQIRSWTGQQDLETLEEYIKKVNLKRVLMGTSRVQKLSK
ncbi:MAG: tyrosine-type recombinase/integrase [Cognatishimia sp.]